MTAKTKVISVQVELDLDAPTQTSRGGMKVWRGECTTPDGWRIFFQVYEPAKKIEKATGLKVTAK